MEKGRAETARPCVSVSGFVCWPLLLVGASQIETKPQSEFFGIDFCLGFGVIARADHVVLADHGIQARDNV